MLRRLLVIGILAVGASLSCLTAAPQEPVPAPTRAAHDDAVAGADEVGGPTIKIVSADRATFQDIPMVVLTCELRNPNQAPLVFLGYRPDSFDPPLAENSISPIHSVELKKDGNWVKYPIGWCGTGMDGIVLGAQRRYAFGCSVPDDPEWTAVRVGVSWGRSTGRFNDEIPKMTIAWSRPLAKDEIGKPIANNEKSAPDSTTGAIRHGKSAGHFAARHCGVVSKTSAQSSFSP
jgi:hypothetical protein